MTVLHEEIHTKAIDYCRFCGKRITAKIQYHCGMYTYGSYEVNEVLEDAEHIDKWGYLCSECKVRKDRSELIKKVDERGTYQQSNYRHRYPLIEYPPGKKVIDGIIYGSGDDRLWKSRDLGKTWDLCNPFEIPRNAIIQNHIFGKDKIIKEIVCLKKEIKALEDDLEIEEYDF